MGFGHCVLGLPGFDWLIMVPLDYWEEEPLAVWEYLWKVPSFEAYHSLPSTNDRIVDLAKDGAPAFTVVVADTQTAGRGRSGKTWESLPGLGLWISFLIRPRLSEVQLLVPILMGIATTRAVEAICPNLYLEIKWPNDVLVGGRKLGGILCEKVGSSALVVGVGINVGQREDDFPSTFEHNATSLEIEGCPNVSRSELAGYLLDESRILVDPLPNKFNDSLLMEIQKRDALVGHMVLTETGEIGQAVGIAGDGSLLIEVEGNHHFIRSGGVSII